MKFSNFHQHTIFSDGKNTAEQIVQSAIGRGMEAIGFSDHSYTSIDESYCMMPDQYEAYFAECARLKEAYRDQIEIYTGLEMDYYSDIDRSKFDYIIGSVHYMYVNGICYPIDHSAAQQKEYIQNECGGDYLLFAKRYYDSLIKHMEKNRPDIVGHFDVLTKYGLVDEENETYQAIARDAIDRILPYVKIFELNTGAIARKCKTVPYPHPNLLCHILEGGGEFILGADSHASDTVDFYFNEATEILRQHGADHIVTFDNGQFRRIDI